VQRCTISAESICIRGGTAKQRLQATYMQGWLRCGLSARSGFVCFPEFVLPGNAARLSPPGMIHAVIACSTRFLPLCLAQ
jgi:hypothetical protein